MRFRGVPGALLAPDSIGEVKWGVPVDASWIRVV